MTRYVLGAIILIVLAVAGIILLAGRDPARPGVDNVEKQVDITDYITVPVDVVLTHEGEIKGEDEYNSIRITVNRNQRKVEHLRGYDGQVLNSQTFPNTQEAFDYFMHALKIAGFSADQKPKYESHKGVCPFGRRFIYELLDGERHVVRLWSSSCHRRDGNFAGRDGQVHRLFENQVPHYRDFVRNIRL